MIQAVLFDMDGVLIDSERLGREVFIAVNRELGYQVSSRFYLSTMGLNGEACQAACRKRFGENYPFWRMEDTWRERMLAYAAEGMPQKPAALDCLRALKERGLTLCLATSSARKIVDRYMERLPFLPYLDHILCGEDAANGKPAPDLYLAAARAAGVPPERCLGVEDSRNGLRALRAAGAHTVMVPDLLPCDGELAELCDDTLASLAELPALLDRLNALRAMLVCGASRAS